MYYQILSTNKHNTLWSDDCSPHTDYLYNMVSTS